MARKLLSLVFVLLFSFFVSAIRDEDEYAILFPKTSTSVSSSSSTSASTSTTTKANPTPTEAPEPTETTALPTPTASPTSFSLPSQEDDVSTMEELSGTPQFKNKLNKYASTLRSSGNSDIFKSSGSTGSTIDDDSDSVSSGKLLKGDDMLDQMKGSSSTGPSDYSSPYLTPKRPVSAGKSSYGYGSSGGAGLSSYSLGGSGSRSGSYAGASSVGTEDF